MYGIEQFGRIKLQQEHSGMWDYLVARLQEPSTYVSLGSVFTGLGIAIAPDYWQAITSIGLGVGGIIGAALREKKKSTPEEIKEVVKDVVVPSAVQKEPV